MESFWIILRAFLFTRVLLLILLNALSFRLGFPHSLLKSTKTPRMRPSSMIVAVAPFLFIVAFSVLPLHGNYLAPRDRAEFDELMAKVARLESMLESNSKMTNSKISLLNEKMHLITELDAKVQTLQDSLKKLKQPSEEFSNSGIACDMEKEVLLLWSKMRENNFDLYILETKAKDAEKRFKSLDSQLREMKDIVTEQWIQIRHLEQALQMSKMRKSNLIGGTFLKLSRTMDPIKKIIYRLQRYHYELQNSVEMLGNNDNVAFFANKEVSFFLASCLIVLPVLPVIFLFVSFFNQ